MTGPILAFAIVGPIAGLIALYRLLNHGEEPCMKTDFSRVFVSQENN